MQPELKEDFIREIEQLKINNRLIIVEGKKDSLALKEFGINPDEIYFQGRVLENKHWIDVIKYKEYSLLYSMNTSGIKCNFVIFLMIVLSKHS